MQIFIILTMTNPPPPLQNFFKTLLTGTECCIEYTSLIVDRATTPDVLLLKTMRRDTGNDSKSQQRNTIARHHSHPVLHNTYTLSAPLNPSRWDSGSQTVMFDGHNSDSLLLDRTRGVSRYNSDPLVLTAPQRSSDNIPLIRYRYLTNNKNNNKIDHESTTSAVTTTPCELPIVPVSTSEANTSHTNIKKRKKSFPTLPPVQEQVITWKRTLPTQKKKKQHTTMRRRKHTMSSSSSVSCVTKVLESVWASKFHPSNLYQPILLELSQVNYQVMSGIQDLIKSAHMLFTTELIPTTNFKVSPSSSAIVDKKKYVDDDDDGIMFVLNVCGGDISPSCGPFFSNGSNKVNNSQPQPQQQQRLAPEIFTI